MLQEAQEIHFNANLTLQKKTLLCRLPAQRVKVLLGQGWGCRSGRQPGSSQETEAGWEWLFCPYHHILSSALTTMPFTPFTVLAEQGSD